MFEAFRQLGRVADAVPFALLHSASKRLVITSVGHSWQAYDCDNLRIALIGPKVINPLLAESLDSEGLSSQFSKKITALACHGDLIFAAVKGGIEVCRRVNRYVLFGHC